MNYAWLGPAYVMVRPSTRDPDWIAARDRESNERLIAGVRERLEQAGKWPTLRQPPDWPAWVVTGKEIPGRAQDGARGLVELAERSGWRAVVTKGQNVGEGSTLTAPRLLTSYAVRLAYPAVGAPRLRAVAVWVNGQCRTSYLWSVGEMPRPVNVTTIRETIGAIAAGVL